MIHVIFSLSNLTWIISFHHDYSHSQSRDYDASHQSIIIWIADPVIVHPISTNQWNNPSQCIRSIARAVSDLNSSLGRQRVIFVIQSHVVIYFSVANNFLVCVAGTDRPRVAELMLYAGILIARWASWIGSREFGRGFVNARLFPCHYD